MKLFKALLCLMIMNHTYGANCDQQVWQSCLDAAYAGVDQELSKLGFDPDTAAIMEPTMSCHNNSSLMRYNWGYIHFGGIIDFEGVTVIDPTADCKHIETTLRWLGSDF